MGSSQSEAVALAGEQAEKKATEEGLGEAESELAVADAKRRKRARQTAENVEVAWLEMNNPQTSSTATSDQSLSSSTKKKLNAKNKEIRHRHALPTSFGVGTNFKGFAPAAGPLEAADLLH